MAASSITSEATLGLGTSSNIAHDQAKRLNFALPPQPHLRSSASAANRRSSWAGVQGANEAAANSADTTWLLGCTPSCCISSNICGRQDVGAATCRCRQHVEASTGAEWHLFGAAHAQGMPRLCVCLNPSSAQTAHLQQPGGIA